VFSTPQKKYPFVLQRGDAKKTSCLQFECDPTAITFKFEQKVLAKDLWLQRNLHSNTEKEFTCASIKWVVVRGSGADDPILYKSENHCTTENIL
jgi:hypothetical protein